MSVPMHKTVRMTFWFLLALLLIVPARPVAAQSTPPPFLFECGKVDGYFTTPRDVAVSQDGYAYVTDGAEHRIQLIDPDGGFVTGWGSYGYGDGQFRDPWGVAVNISEGLVYAVDSGNNRVQVFTREGAYLTQWDGSASTGGRFSQPAGIAVHDDGSVFVADAGNHRIVKFDANGNFQFEFGKQGNQPGYFDLPTGIALDGNGNIFVAEVDNQRIQMFDAAGNHIAFAPVPGEPSDIAVAAYRKQNRIFVTNQSGNVIHTFQEDLTPSSDFGGSGALEGEFDGPVGIGIGREGNVHVADSGNSRVQIFDMDRNFLRMFGGDLVTPNGLVAPPGKLSKPHDVAIDNDGNVYVADTGNDRVVKFDADCNYLNSWGSWGDSAIQPSSPVEFNEPKGITVDDNNRVWVADTANNRIQAFNENGGRLDWWPPQAPVSSSLALPNDVAVAADGTVYVANTGYGQVVKLDARLRPYPSTVGSFITAAGLETNSNGLLFVVDSSAFAVPAAHDYVEYFDSPGTLLGGWGVYGSGAGELQSPHGIDITERGYVFVTDTWTHRVNVYKEDGRFDSYWGLSIGAGPGQFDEPHGVAVNDINGRVYVADTNNNRIQVFGGNNLPRSAAPSNAPTVTVEQPAIFLPLVARQTP